MSACDGGEMGVGDDALGGLEGLRELRGLGGWLRRRFVGVDVPGAQSSRVRFRFRPRCIGGRRAVDGLGRGQNDVVEADERT